MINLSRRKTMSGRRLCAILLAASGLSLAACGGGGGGGQVASLAPPPVTPAPPPAETPLPPAHIGLVSDKPFAVLATGDTYTTDANGNHPAPASPPALQDAQFSYNPSTGSYLISLPGFQPGTLVTASYNGTAGQVATGSFNHVTAGSST